MSGDTVNKVPLSAVQEKSTSKSQENDEVDLINNDSSNLVVRGNKKTEEIEIIFTHTEKSSDISIDELRDELRKLQNDSIENVTHEIDGRVGRIAIENINVPETSDSRNVREIVIQGKFLPWPKHYASNRPTLYEILDSSLFGRLSTNTDLDIERLLSKSQKFILNVSGRSYKKRSVSSDIDTIFETSVPADLILSVKGNKELSGNISAKFGFIYDYGYEYGGEYG